MTRKLGNDRKKPIALPETEAYYQRVAIPAKISPELTALEQMYGYYDAL